MDDPIDMVLHCPQCGLQHIDAAETHGLASGEQQPEESAWNNPPHRSHLCHGCGCIWRPADVPTNGVLAIKTRGAADTWPAGVKERSPGCAYPQCSCPSKNAEPVCQCASSIGGVHPSSNDQLKGGA